MGHNLWFLIHRNWRNLRAIFNLSFPQRRSNQCPLIQSHILEGIQKWSESHNWIHSWVEDYQPQHKILNVQKPIALNSVESCHSTSTLLNLGRACLYPKNLLASCLWNLIPNLVTSSTLQSGTGRAYPKCNQFFPQKTNHQGFCTDHKESTKQLWLGSSIDCTEFILLGENGVLECGSHVAEDWMFHSSSESNENFHSSLSEKSHDSSSYHPNMFNCLDD